ncbi:hypothetical protein BC938DRAFT_471558 [Jimgerdemannia flammicorona]|uniref:Uncharacterized protein n=1 Tax=Jimgerdemannia flammicorona TaxID=994334 RepID=A0A433Q7U1_9FUNG|nr:hypothetical protein BC938DRAFT_471558 [Jimgerdemannia flammicorona]
MDIGEKMVLAVWTAFVSGSLQLPLNIDLGSWWSDTTVLPSPDIPNMLFILFIEMDTIQYLKNEISKGFSQTKFYENFGYIWAHRTEAERDFRLAVEELTKWKDKKISDAAKFILNRPIEVRSTFAAVKLKLTERGYTASKKRHNTSSPLLPMSEGSMKTSAQEI